jgi:hypothetical protein
MKIVNALALLSVAAIFGCVILGNSSYWIVLPACLIILLRIFILFQDTPNSSHFKEAFLALVIPLAALIIAGWRDGLEKLARFIDNPSWNNLLATIANPEFLFFVLAYFAYACFLFKRDLKKQKEAYELLLKKYLENQKDERGSK